MNRTSGYIHMNLIISLVAMDSNTSIVVVSSMPLLYLIWCWIRFYITIVHIPFFCPSSVKDKSFSERSVALESRGGWCLWQSELFFDRYQWLPWYRNTTIFIGQIVSDETALLVTVRPKVSCLSSCLGLWQLISSTGVSFYDIMITGKRWKRE
jgi:hypothetical protein